MFNKSHILSFNLAQKYQVYARDREPLLSIVSRDLGKMRTIDSVGEEITEGFANIYEAFEDAKNVNLYFLFLF